MLRLTRNGVRGAMCDQGRTWGPQQLIFDPADPPDASLATNQHLGTLRHSILVEDDGRWLLPLTVGGPRGSPTAKGVGTRSLCEWYQLDYPGVQVLCFCWLLASLRLQYIYIYIYIYCHAE
jgi:hypothetical protein